MDHAKNAIKTTTTPTVLVIGLSILMLFGLVFLVYGNRTQMAHAEQNIQGETMSNNKGGGAADDLISPITEWVGIAAIGMAAGLVMSLGTKFNNNYNNSTDLLRKTIFVSMAVLSISVGIIHLLLVKEHMTESYIWGIGFLSMGIPQILYGMIIMIFAKNFLSSAKTVYNIGIAGNVLFIGIFIYVRLFVPPFSPDGTPVNELQTNGILTVIIQSILVALLVYLLKGNKVKKQTIARRMANPK